MLSLIFVVCSLNRKINRFKDIKKKYILSKNIINKRYCSFFTKLLLLNLKLTISQWIQNCDIFFFCDIYKLAKQSLFILIVKIEQYYF